MAGLVPAISLRDALQMDAEELARHCQPERDGRDKPGHDKSRVQSLKSPQISW